MADSLLQLKEIDSVSYALAFPVAVFLGYASYWVLYHPQFNAFLESWIGARHVPAESDLLSEIAESPGPVVVSMTNGQVYVGLVRGVTKDPDQDHRLVALAYFLSGARTQVNESTGVKYNYAVEYDKDNPKLIYLEFRNVVSIAEFNLLNFVSSIQDKYVRISEETMMDFLLTLELINQITEKESTELFKRFVEHAHPQ